MMRKCAGFADIGPSGVTAGRYSARNGCVRVLLFGSRKLDIIWKYNDKITGSTRGEHRTEKFLMKILIFAKPDVNECDKGEKRRHAG